MPKSSTFPDVSEVDAVEAEAEALARKAAADWPRRVAGVLHLVARISAMDVTVEAMNATLAESGSNRRIASPYALAKFDPPLTVGDALWAAILTAPPPTET